MYWRVALTVNGQMYGFSSTYSAAWIVHGVLTPKPCADSKNQWSGLEAYDT